MTNKNELIITPVTKVGDLLDAYPQLEEVLIGLSPAFEKLKNPILRRTVAKVATLQQIAGIGNVKVEEVVNCLRTAIGQKVTKVVESNSDFTVTQLPQWLAKGEIVKRFDATVMLNKGENPMPHVLKFTKELFPGQIFELITPFVPTPMLDLLKGKGFKVCCIKDKECFKSYVLNLQQEVE